MGKEMQGLFIVLLIPFIIILVLIATFMDVTAPLGQIVVTTFVVVYFIFGGIISVIVLIKLEKIRWKGRKKKEEDD